MTLCSARHGTAAAFFSCMMRETRFGEGTPGGGGSPAAAPRPEDRTPDIWQLRSREEAEASWMAGYHPAQANIAHDLRRAADLAAAGEARGGGAAGGVKGENGDMSSCGVR